MRARSDFDSCGAPGGTSRRHGDPERARARGPTWTSLSTQAGPGRTPPGPAGSPGGAERRPVVVATKAGLISKQCQHLNIISAVTNNLRSHEAALAAVTVTVTVTVP